MVKATVEALDIDPKTGTTLGFYTFGEERPNILIVSAMDGWSATDVYSSYLIMKHLRDLDRINGSVTVLPVASPLAFRLGVKVSPLDSKDINVVFPGNEHGSVTERSAWEIWRRVVQADYVIHLRTGEQSCVSHVVALHRDYIHVRNLASQIALPIVIQSTGRRGTLITEAAHEGVAAVAIEMRGVRNGVDPQAAVEVREAVLNFMRIKGMLPEEGIEAASSFTGITRQVNVDSEGFFVPSARPGEEVRGGDIIGTVQDKGDVVSPYDGTVVSMSQMVYVFDGDMIARIAAPLVDRPRRMDSESEEAAPPRRKW
jgi:predicted deacylase